jgi:hypothetical protein
VKLFAAGFMAALILVGLSGFVFRAYLRWDWERKLPHDSKSLQIALLSAEEVRLEREDQLREAITQRDLLQDALVEEQGSSDSS